jgi:hypothetical protein
MKWDEGPETCLRRWEEDEVMGEFYIKYKRGGPFFLVSEMFANSFIKLFLPIHGEGGTKNVVKLVRLSRLLV